MTRFLWICLGGAAGTGARYLLSGWVLHLAGPGFPWGTLAVNALGSFLLGLQILRLSEDLPVLIEIVDTPRHVAKTRRLAATQKRFAAYPLGNVANLVMAAASSDIFAANPGLQVSRTPLPKAHPGTTAAKPGRLAA